MKSLLDKEIREILDRVYAEESSELYEELMQMQLASLPKEDWQCVDEELSNELDE